MFPIKDRIILDNLHGGIVCAYLNNVLISDEQCRLLDSTEWDGYLIRGVEIKVEIDNKNYLMYYSIDLTHVNEDIDNHILPLTFYDATEVL